MPRSPIWSLICVFFFLSQLSSIAQARTFGEVMAWCTAPKQVGDDRLCDAYLSAGLELFQSSDPVYNAGHQICLPSGVGVKTVIPILAKWLELHPEARGEPAAPVAATALAQRYPCH